MGMTALDMTQMAKHGTTMMMPAVWTVNYAILMFFMWWIMMVAMMLPSAAPMILFFAAVNARQRDIGDTNIATFVFAFGYLATWAVFSIIAVALQWSLQHRGLLSPVLVGTSTNLAGGLLLAAGVYQLTPIKTACLRICRSPHVFLSSRWQPGAKGALRMGIAHGAYCAGCCWFLMLLLFVGGAMNLYWIIGLALFVLVEKLTPVGHRFTYASGIALSTWGIGVLIDWN
jgi:predicted metal-binding membrane protein